MATPSTTVAFAAEQMPSRLRLEAARRVKLPGGIRALGLYLEHPGVDLEEVVELAEATEAAGFGIVAVGDGYAENFALLGALAARTRRVELISAITTWTRTPVTTALAATTVAQLSRNRFRLGLGAPARQWSEDWHGIDFAHPVERMRDFVAAVRTAWSSAPGVPVSHEGPFYRIRDYERPSAPPTTPIPLYLGANRPRMIELAGEIADGVILSGTLHSAEWLRNDTWPILEQGLARAGRERTMLDVGLTVPCAIADDARSAYELLRPGLMFNLPRYRDLLHARGFGREFAYFEVAATEGNATAMASAITDRMVDSMSVAGTADEVWSKLHRYEGLIDWVTLVPPFGLPVEASREQVRRIIATVAGA